jgi:N-acetylmuramic acid 6-phosphate etherase
MTVLCPASCKELGDMLEWAVEKQNGPVAIRYPRGGDRSYQDSAFGGGMVCCHRSGADVTLVTYGTLVENAMNAAKLLEEKGISAIEADGATAGDVVVGLSASGRAPFVIGALKKAKELGCKTISVTCNPGSLMENYCDVAVSVYVGPEVISGSTRLKAGTAQKLILNMFSTCAMIKTGKVRSNLMVNVRPTNEKLVERATRIIMQLSDADRATAEHLLAEYGDVPSALDAYEGKR